ncbi:hypothetical protein [Actinopolymorpha cephalotaxi]|uniref:Uncharacterized protein n=1 Tax=Actinopolymorpha cephalotaxi TaxID=504797 RepID=A0ABX2S709_9ACTN|nr:hypothetical protein [Actinopolymorpha cephalotaxi]NYH84117.1 hypothetical protein [Actinopolymorpha cephalotaxi]
MKHCLYEFVGPGVAVAVAHVTDLLGLIGDRDLIDGVDGPTPGHVADIVDSFPWPGEVPVDENDWASVPEDGLVVSRVAMSDTFVSGGEGVTCGEVVEITEHPPTKLGSAGGPPARVD